ncbi:unnamed protein product [Orchesella dallaii]|uniref:Uncharacterized protein n=1 Tax=Orchesella dallaii TaxID=48710 RepID=A0ABP1R8L9_9HEXA
MSNKPEDVFKQYSCVNCQDLIKAMGIQCVECHNGNLTLCVECFSLGAELGDHKPDHSYRFVSSRLEIPDEKEFAKDVPLVPTVSSGHATRRGGSTSRSTTPKTPGWSLEEEFTLLKNVESLGYGNWKSISKAMKPRTPKEVKEKYKSRYVLGLIGKQTWSTPHCKGITDHIDETPLYQRLLNLPPFEMTSELKAKLGYDPIPEENDNESDDETEKTTLMEPIEFNADDTEDQTHSKLELVRGLCDRVKEKEKNKQLLKDHQILRAIHAAERSLTTRLTEITELEGTVSVKQHVDEHKIIMKQTLRPFIKNYPLDELNKLLKYLLREKVLALQKKVKELCEQRKKLKEGNSSSETISVNQQEQNLNKRKIEVITLDDDDETPSETTKEQVEEGVSGKPKEGLNGGKKMLANVIIKEKAQFPVNSDRLETKGMIELISTY